MSYWSDQTRLRIQRRRLLKAGSGIGLAVAAASLLNCGGGSDKEAGSGDQSRALYQPTDTSNKAAKGGTYTEAWPQNVQSFSFKDSTGDANQVLLTHSRLVKLQDYKYPKPVEPG